MIRTDSFFGISRISSSTFCLFCKAAEQGDDEAQRELGGCYFNGIGVEQSYERAVEWFSLAASQGNVVAQSNLADCYENGYGVERSRDMAMSWYKAAALQGDTRAKIMYSMMDLYGDEMND